MRSLTSLFSWTLVAMAVMTSLWPVNGEINLLPNWHMDPQPATERPGAGSNCAAYLDVNVHGNPNCPIDQQYFDTATCSFLCESSLGLGQVENGIGEARNKNNVG